MVTRRLARLDALATTAGLWFLGKFLRYAFPPLFGTLAAVYGVSRTALGTAFTGFMLVYAAMQFPSGVVADRVGPVRVIVAGALVTAAGALALVVDSPFLVLAGAMVVMGGGTGAHKTVAVGLLARVYPARTGRALGAFDTCGSLAGVAAPAVVVAVAGLPGVLGAPWRTLFLAAGLAGIVLVAAFALRVPRRLADEASLVSETGTTPDDPVSGSGDGRSASGPTDAVRRYAALFGRPRFAAFVLVTVLFGFAYNGTVAFLPLYLATEGGLGETTANLLYGLLFAASLVQLVTGEASDRVGVLPVLAATLAVATAGLLGTLALSPGPAVGLGVTVLALGLGAHGFRPVRGAYLMSTLPDTAAGGGLGAVRTLLMGAGAVGPAVVGYLSEAAGFRAAFGLLVAALAAATALTVGLWLLE